MKKISKEKSYLLTYLPQSRLPLAEIAANFSTCGSSLTKEVSEMMMNCRIFDHYSDYPLPIFCIAREVRFCLHLYSQKFKSKISVHPDISRPILVRLSSESHSGSKGLRSVR